MRGLYIGRFQPFHNGHLELVHHILGTFHPQELLIGIGSAQVSHTPHNPFTAGERFEMVRRALFAEHLEDFWPLPIPDVDRHAIWVAHVVSLVPSFDQVYSNDPLTVHLFREEGYEVPRLPFFNRGQYEGSEIRRRMAAGQSWQELVPAAVRVYLEEIKGEERVRLLSGSPEAARLAQGNHGTGRDPLPRAPSIHREEGR
ncbi:MAG: nicotinamide-nucleotide adenylyltransferase [Euryarchaeota archaeon]|nr:nicotinamide-nucleotide adenylyltransferase [Euryarchaeota archaeon]MDE1835119.1 nicotinamide-nucleotide adenylyltransferase [Euryarchaeota archaeon]MDE1880695.1 nicotinamide-nucleotide adenylyltransferase [Euryarchaeota archaeon]MDE2044918.1 nicotinamide-nucleotide adenylyltransferase [Thermoplasmata archaeon]